MRRDTQSFKSDAYSTHSADLEAEKDKWTNIVKIRDLVETSATTKWWYCTGVGATGPTFGFLPKISMLGSPLDVFVTSTDDASPPVRAPLPKSDFTQQVPVVRTLVDTVEGLALGKGTLVRVKEAYRWLCRNFAPGDKIFIFGFSRGGFAARCLNGLIRYMGIVRTDATLGPEPASSSNSGGGGGSARLPSPAAATTSACFDDLIDLAVNTYNSACMDGLRPDDTGRWVCGLYEDGFGSDRRASLVLQQHDGLPHEALDAMVASLPADVRDAVAKRIEQASARLQQACGKSLHPLLVPATFRELYCHKLATTSGGGGFADTNGSNFVMSALEPGKSTVPLVQMLGECHGNDVSRR